MKKKYSPEAGLLLFISLLVLVVSISGIVTYNNLISLSSDLKKNSKDDSKLELLKQINTQLYQLESNVRTFYFTRDSSYLDEFGISKALINDKLRLFETKSRLEPGSYSPVDTVKILVNEKFNVLDKWIGLVPDVHVVRELNKIPRNLDEELQEDGSIKNKKRKKNTVDLESVKDEIKTAQNRQSVQLRQINQQELELNLTNTTINRQLNHIIEQMDSEESVRKMLASENAIEKARFVNFLIASFCISSVVLLIITGLILVKYIRKTNDSKKALRAAKHESENLAIAKQNFLANMTHEIRTPINSIVGFTEQLSKSDLDPDQKEQVDIVRKSSQHLLRIVNDVLDYSKLQAGKFNFEKITFNPRETIREVIDILASEADSKQVKLKYTIDENMAEYMLGDPFRLQQILLNLVGNAIKFTEKGSVGVHVSSGRSDGGKVFLKTEIKDTGIGIPADKMSLVYNDFEQAENSVSKRYRGTGLGLSITRKLVEKQGGNIRISSKEGEGTLVNVMIPYTIADPPKAEPEKQASYSNLSLAGKKVLVVDDEPFNRKLLKVILNQWGAAVEEAHDGESALHLINNRAYDLVLMDVRMPGMSGIEATKIIRKHPDPEKTNLIIVAVTATNDKEKEQKCLEAGMNAFLVKPFTEQNLYTLITELGVAPELTVQTQQRTNMDELMKLGGGDKQFINEMIHLFIKGANECLANVKAALETNDRKAMGDAAHKIAPACRHLGAARMLELVKMLEKQAATDIPNADLGILINELEKETLSTIEEVKKHLSQ